MTHYPGKLKAELRHELESILKYWTDNCLDNVFGGFVGRADHFNSQIKGASKLTTFER